MPEKKKEIMPTHVTKMHPNPEPNPQRGPAPKIIGPFGEPGPEPDAKKGWNWRSTLPGFAGICSVLAGFSVALIALLMTWQVANTKIGVFSLTFGQIAVLLFGISAGLLVGAEEFLLHATEFDVYALPERYFQLYKNVINDDKKFAENVETQTKALHNNATLARRFYNVAIILVFIGLGFAIAPYSIVIAIIVAGIGLSMELIQYLSMRSQPSPRENQG